jgi:hypothetical protein
MKLLQLLPEANYFNKIAKDPQKLKQLAIAIKHDGTFSKNAVAKLGPKPTDEDLSKAWSNVLDDTLRRTRYGDISADGKFDDWLFRLYITGAADYEDINGEGGDALGAWKALSIRNKLRPEHQDFNKFKSIRQIQRIIQDRSYRDELARIANAAEIEGHKRDKKEATLIDDDRFLVVIPFNYGSCYTFNNAHGYNASFCTGSSSGHRWFNRYADEGPIVSILDKANSDDVNGKWQMHAPTNQMNNGNQTTSYSRGDEKFAELFPGLMKRIVAAISAKGEEINQGSQDIMKGGYDIAKAVADIKKHFPLSYASEEPKKDDEAAADGPGTYLVTHTATGRTARIEGESKQDVQDKLLARHPNVNVDDFTFELQQEQQENVLY